MTIPALQQMKRDGRKIVAVVTYDYQMAQIVDRAGVDIVSVGDSVGINLWGPLSSSIYPADEPPLPRSVHIRRALGGPLASLLLTLFALILVLMLAVSLVAVPVAVLSALVAARREGGWFDRSVNVASMCVAALPEFVVGIAVIAMFATSVFHWFPAVSVIYGSTSVLSS